MLGWLWYNLLKGYFQFQISMRIPEGQRTTRFEFETTKLDQNKAGKI